ncbi:MAG: M28 family peptidase [Clostridia bacterium]|nr:M28 family peptidase [Clostridia bacterium]
MKTLNRIIPILLTLTLCIMFIASIADAHEVRQDTNFNQENILTHIQKLSENGPRSIAHKEANQKAIDYIVSEVERYGAVQGDVTDVPAYLVQDFVATDTESRYQNWYLKNVIVHIPANAENPSNQAIMFMGHTDSVPMGQGSSDDGVACSVMLEAIRYYLDKMENGYTLTHDLVFCFVNGEEYELYGSRAFMNEFKGFDNVVERIRFGTNLESRGTQGTLIMFETAANNYNTIKLFSEVNKSLFTCSIATMVYDSMPNGTDFSNFKEAYQGLNVANILGGENYHTQNDNPENVGLTYLSQQAQIVDALIDKLANYDLDSLYDAEESAIFFSYLNITTVVYNHTTVIILAVLLILMLAANVLLSALWRKQRNLRKTAEAFVVLVAGVAWSAVLAWGCYYLFSLIAALFGVIDFHMIGTITYSNTAIVIGLGLLSLAACAITTHFGTKWLKLEYRDVTRAFAYLHAFLGIVLSFALPDASYLFVFSGILFMANELAITLCRKHDLSLWHGELLATALYMPILMPVILLATSALGLTMAEVYGAVFALGIFAVAICAVPALSHFSLRSLWRAIRKKEHKVSPAEGSAHVMAIALVLFLAVSLGAHDASVNLQGKQNIAKLPYDDALVYVLDENGNAEYRIYDLNAKSALDAYAPDMTWKDDHYAGKGEQQQIAHALLCSAEGNVIHVKKNTADSLVYLDFSEINATSFTVDDGLTKQIYVFKGDTHAIKLHSDCTVTLNGGTAKVACKEVLRDYVPLIPAQYANDNEQLHFNLWLTAEYELK